MRPTQITAAIERVSSARFAQLEENLRQQLSNIKPGSRSGIYLQFAGSRRIRRLDAT